MAQELLAILDQEIPEFSLKLGRGGIFEIRANGALVWSRKEQGGRWTQVSRARLPLWVYNRLLWCSNPLAAASEGV